MGLLMSDTDSGKIAPLTDPPGSDSIFHDVCSSSPPPTPARYLTLAQSTTESSTSTSEKTNIPTADSSKAPPKSGRSNEFSQTATKTNSTINANIKTTNTHIKRDPPRSIAALVLIPQPNPENPADPSQLPPTSGTSLATTLESLSVGAKSPHGNLGEKIVDLATK